MSPPEDQVAVPPPDVEPTTPASLPDGAPVPATLVRASAPTAPPDLRFALSPARAAVGFGILASLILLALGRRWRRRG